MQTQWYARATDGGGLVHPRISGAITKNKLPNRVLQALHLFCLLYVDRLGVAHARSGWRRLAAMIGGREREEREVGVGLHTRGCNVGFASRAKCNYFAADPTHC